MKGLGNLLQQAQEIQNQMQQAQQDLKDISVTGESGGGMVKITMTGNHQVKKVRIDATLYGDDQDMIEDLVAAAINDAVNKLEKKTKDKMSDITGGINLPPGFKLPF